MNEPSEHPSPERDSHRENQSPEIEPVFESDLEDLLEDREESLLLKFDFGFNPVVQGAQPEEQPALVSSSAPEDSKVFKMADVRDWEEGLDQALSSAPVESVSSTSSLAPSLFLKPTVQPLLKPPKRASVSPPQGAFKLQQLLQGRLLIVLVGVFLGMLVLLTLLWALGEPEEDLEGQVFAWRTPIPSLGVPIAEVGVVPQQQPTRVSVVAKVDMEDNAGLVEKEPDFSEGAGKLMLGAGGESLPTLEVKRAWEPLIDKDRLSGWKSRNQTTWSIEDGLLRLQGSTQQKSLAFLHSDKAYRSVALTLKAQPESPATTFGILARARSDGAIRLEFSNGRASLREQDRIVPLDWEWKVGSWHQIAFIVNNHEAMVFIDRNKVGALADISLDLAGRLALYCTDGSVEMRSLYVQSLD